MRTVARMLCALSVGCGVATSANAIPILRLTTSGGDTATVMDGGAGDSSPLQGVVVFVSPLGGQWSVNVTTGLSKPMIGSADAPELDLNSVNVSSIGGPSWIDIELTDTDFTERNGPTVLASIGGTTNGSVSYQTFFDASNTAFGRATELTSVSGLGPAFAATASNVLTSAQPYSLTLLVRISHAFSTLPQVSSFDATVKVPEPSTLLLFGSGLLGLVVLGHRRRRDPARLVA